MTKDEIVTKVLGSKALSAVFSKEVEERNEVLRLLPVLKAEHRIWPTGEKYTITEKGKKNYG